MPWLIPSTLGMYLFAGIAGLGYAVYSAVDQALLVDVLPNKEEAGKDLGILNMGTTLGQMCGPVIMSTIVVSLGYNFAFPTAIALAIIGAVLKNGYVKNKVMEFRGPRHLPYDHGLPQRHRRHDHRDHLPFLHLGD